MAEGECEVFVEEIFEEFAHPEVGPASVDEQEALQVPELRDGEVGREDSLHALHATDPHTYMSS